MRTRLPHKIIRRKKQGFNLPKAAWLKNKLRPFVLEHLSPAHIKEMEILDCKYVDLVLKEHFSRKKDNSHQIWCLLTLSLRWKQFIGKNRIFY